MFYKNLKLINSFIDTFSFELVFICLDSTGKFVEIRHSLKAK